MSRGSYDPDEEYGAETWADDERTRRMDDAMEQRIHGYGNENNPNRKVDRDSIARRLGEGDW